MLFRNMLLKYYAEAGDEGSADGAPPASQEQQPPVQQEPVKADAPNVLNTPENEKPTDEELANWRKENNVPEKPDAYLEGLPSGIVFDDADRERVNSFLSDMHGKNVSKEHVQAAIEWNQRQIEQEMVARHERNMTAQQSTEDELRQEWGPEYRRNINLINGMLEGLPQDSKELFLGAQTADGVSIFNNPGVAKFFVDLARQINPVGTVVPGASNVSAIDTEIEQIEKVMKENRTAYNKDTNMQERYMQLLEAKERFTPSSTNPHIRPRFTGKGPSLLRTPLRCDIQPMRKQTNG